MLSTEVHSFVHHGFCQCNYFVLCNNTDPLISSFLLIIFDHNSSQYELYIVIMCVAFTLISIIANDKSCKGFQMTTVMYCSHWF